MPSTKPNHRPPIHREPSVSNIGVLCAIDVNDHDPDVIDLAARFAKLYGCNLDLLHVTLAPDATEFAWQAYAGPRKDLLHDNQKLREISSSIDGVNVHQHHLSGTPSQMIIDFAQSQKPTLLVLGTHARKGLQRIFGSVAATVMRNVDCPVLVLRQRQV